MDEAEKVLACLRGNPPSEYEDVPIQTATIPVPGEAIIPSNEPPKKRGRPPKAKTEAYPKEEGTLLDKLTDSAKDCLQENLQTDLLSAPSVKIVTADEVVDSLMYPDTLEPEITLIPAPAPQVERFNLSCNTHKKEVQKVFEELGMSFKDHETITLARQVSALLEGTPMDNTFFDNVSYALKVVKE